MVSVISSTVESIVFLTSSKVTGSIDFSTFPRRQSAHCPWVHRNGTSGRHYHSAVVLLYNERACELLPKQIQPANHPSVDESQLSAEISRAAGQGGSGPRSIDWREGGGLC